MTDFVLSFYQALQAHARPSPYNSAIRGLLCCGIVYDLVTALQTEQWSLVNKAG